MNGSPDSYVIQARGLTKYFGDFLAVDRVTFNVLPGEILGYLGPNGSGKTTTIRMLLGLLKPSQGSARVLGFDTEAQSERVRANSGYMSQKFALYHELTVMENLTFYAGVYGISEKNRVLDVIEMMGLAGFEDQRVSSLSTGWRQRLALATAIVHQPQLLFLDEPTSGVDPNARRSFWDLIYGLVDQGITALVTTHYMDEAEYCSRVGIMRDGQLLAVDTPSELKRQALPGLAWDIFMGSPSDPDRDVDSYHLLQVLNTLNSGVFVSRAGLASDHIRVITPADVEDTEILNFLEAAGEKDVFIEKVEPSLEDVFLALATRD